MWLLNELQLPGFVMAGGCLCFTVLRNTDLAATVVFYGSSETDPEILKNLPGPVLGIFGGADQSIPLEEVNALENGLETAGIPHQIIFYDGQPHAFMLDAEAVQTEPVQTKAWNEMLAFLETNLKLRTSSNEPKPDGISYIPAFPWKYYALLVYEHAFGSSSHHH